jgi:GR25 family glycosyltransferase involved in LPS biosynthesis
MIQSKPWVPEQALVISLESRTDRRTALRRSLPNLGFQATMLDAVDGSSSMPSNDNWRGSPESWACAESHIRALSRPGNGPKLILEDDVIIPANFQARMKDLLRHAPRGWDVLMLGGQHQLHPYSVNDGVLRCMMTGRAHAYVVRNRKVADLLIEVARDARYHWDSFLARSMHHLIHAYAPDPFIIWTSNSPSSIPDSWPPPGKRQRSKEAAQ